MSSRASSHASATGAAVAFAVVDCRVSVIVERFVRASRPAGVTSSTGNARSPAWRNNPRRRSSRPTVCQPARACSFPMPYVESSVCPKRRIFSVSAPTRTPATCASPTEKSLFWRIRSTLQAIVDEKPNGPGTRGPIAEQLLRVLSDPNATLAYRIWSGDDSIVVLRDHGDRGEIVQHKDITSGTEVSPAVSRDGIAIFGTNDMFEYGVDHDGLLWRFPRNSLSYSSPAVTDAGLAYFGDHNGYMNVVDVHSGCLVARYQGGGEIWTSPAIDARGDVYFGTKSGHILGFAFDGTKLFDIDTHRTVDSYPAITADGTLLIGSENGLLYAIGG